MNEITGSEILHSITTLAFGVTIIICIAWAVVTAIKALKQRADTRTRADIYNRLIDKFGTAPEFATFLASEAGLKFMEDYAIQSSTPLRKILTSTQLGIVLLLVGVGLLVTGNIFGESLGGDLYILLTVGGTVGLMLGLGFLISAAVSYRLCKAWGILTTRD